MRLIDADALLEALGDGPISWTDTPEEIQAVNDWREFVSMINDTPTIGGWIAVTDRMPEAGTTCLLYAGGCIIVGRYIEYDQWLTPGVGKAPTHWMPLPEPPKEVSGNADGA